MTLDSAHELLEALLREEVPTEADLLAFLGSEAVNEGLYLEFKHGKELGKPKKARNFTLRQYVAAFANSEGGILMIGVEDKTKKLAPITDKHEKSISGEHQGGQDLKGWAASVVGDLVGYLGVPPRFHVVEVEGGKVLLVAVARAPTLVPLHHQARIKHFFRIEDEAREVPSSLVADLVLGRRQTPFLKVTAKAWSLATESESSISGNGLGSCQGDVVTPEVLFEITNESLVKAESVRAGLLAWCVVPEGSEKTEPIVGDLLARIVSEEPAGSGMLHRLVRLPMKWKATSAVETDRLKWGLTFRPFDRFSMEIDGNREWTFAQQDEKDLEACAALYLLPDGGEPLWFEVRLPVYGRRLTNEGERHGRPIIASTEKPRIERVVGRRPLVSLTAKREAA